MAAVNAVITFWSCLLEDFARYARAANRELMSLNAGRSDPNDTIRRLSDLGREYWQGLADLPRRLVTQFDVGSPRGGTRPRRAARIID